ARIGRADTNHRWVRSMEGDKFTIRNEQTVGSGVFDCQRGETIVRPDAEEVSVTYASLGLNEFVTNVIAEAKCVEDVLPVAAAKDKRFPMLLLPLKQFGLHAPPRIEMDVFNPADVINIIHLNASAQWLAMNIPN